MGVLSAITLILDGVELARQAGVAAVNLWGTFQDVKKLRDEHRAPGQEWDAQDARISALEAENEELSKPRPAGT